MPLEITVTVSDEALHAVRHDRKVKLRLVIDSDQAAPQPQPAGPPRGPLAALIERGDLKVGEHLYWQRPRLRQRFIATVLASGELEIDGCRYRSPSDAATACAGSPANGWTAWRLEDGTLLDKLRP
ncbi:hypothetical protein [Micromonospora sp. NPDC003816]|uniref:restriction system modified-DNA reader domain-containing protein n=1 Tax=Micromonospora sp. NPDC003816 TaxID=3364224 RepID=UPI00369AA1C0